MIRMQVTRIIALWMAGLLVAAQPCMAMVVGYCRAGGTPAETYTQVFADDFNREDSGTVGGSWTSETDTGSLLGIVSNTMQWAGDVAASGYVTTDLVSSYYKSKAEVDFKTSTLSATSGGSIQFLQTRNASNANSAIVAIKATSTTLNQVDLIWYDEAGTATTASQAYTFVADTSYTITLEASVATGSSTNDGTITVLINGTPVISLTGLDTYTRQVRYARAGMIYTAMTGTSRTLTFDDFYFGENGA